MHAYSGGIGELFLDRDENRLYEWIKIRGWLRQH